MNEGGVGLFAIQKNNNKIMKMMLKKHNEKKVTGKYHGNTSDMREVKVLLHFSCECYTADLPNITPFICNKSPFFNQLH